MINNEKKSLAVLIIDDSKVARKIIKRHLRSFRRNNDLEIYEAGSGSAALKMLRRRSFDCVFLDYVLGDMDGVALLKELYDPETDLAGSPFVMITAHGSDALMRNALRQGAQDYLPKDALSSASINIAIAKARELFEFRRIRHEAELQLRQNHRMEAVGQLTSGVAHDFNNLLMVVLGNTRLLRRRITKNSEKFSLEDAEQKIHAIERAANKGAELVRRLMIFTRQTALEQETTDINKCVEETFALLKGTLGKTIEIEIVHADKSWPVFLDVSGFEHVLINLAINARDAMREGGKLTVETRNVMLDEAYALRYPEVTPGPYVLIKVSDTGKGMNPETIRHIFEPFFTTKSIGEGTGLGLSMVYGFIRQSKGHIYVHSKPDRGSVFRIYLPRDRQEDSTDTGPQENPVSDRPDRKEAHVQRTAQRAR